MKDISSPKWLYAKGFLFLLMGLMASAGILLELPSWRVAFLLATAVWGFSRFYYFAFYVIEHYIEPGHRFSGLGSFVRHLIRRARGAAALALVCGGLGHAWAGGRMETIEGVHSPELENDRRLIVYLPASYDATPPRAYPVLYMHDGQNLFERRTSSSTIEWRVDEAMDRLGSEGLVREAIVVGIESNAERIEEYTPSRDAGEGRGGRGEAYLDFIEYTVAPLIAARYRTLAGPRNTLMAGSSLGGLISLYAAWTRPGFVGAAACLSTSLWWNEEEMLRRLKAAPAKRPDVRLYLDGGGKEGAIRPMRRVAKALRRKGFRPGVDLLVVEDPDGIHMEDAWARRFPGALRFLLPPA